MLSNEEEYRRQVEERSVSLNEFVRNLGTSYPDYFKQNVSDKLSEIGSQFDYLGHSNKETINVDPSSLEYREAQIDEDGSLYEGTWNKVTS